MVCAGTENPLVLGRKIRRLGNTIWAGKLGASEAPLGLLLGHPFGAFLAPKVTHFLIRNDRP